MRGGADATKTRRDPYNTLSRIHEWSASTAAHVNRGGAYL